jgi:hypothetical protein
MIKKEYKNYCKFWIAAPQAARNDGAKHFLI